MTWALVALGVIYLLGFAAVFLFHMALGGMVSPGLSLLRSLLWPVFVTTGRPRGRRLPMD